jgi:DUF4097 and DUF4098 domain-containing protein YvlB
MTQRTETFQTPEPITLVVTTQVGRLEVVATDDTTTTVELSSSQDDDRIATIMDRTRIELRGEKLVIDTPHKYIRRHTDLSLLVRLPIGSVVRAKLAAAQLSTSGELERVEVDAASGTVDIGDVTGDVTVNSVSGNVTVGRAGGRSTVRSASGELAIRSAGREVAAHSASGEITVGAAEGSVTARTASGDIRIGKVERGRIALVSASGDLKVGIAPGAGVWLDVSSISGDTRSELDIEASKPAEGCAVELYARTLSGDVHLERATA